MNGKIRGKIPKIEKSVREFIKDESGSVTKDNILKAGIALGVASFALMGTATADHTSHTNNLSGTYDDPTKSITGSHSHHGQHNSY